MILTRRDLLRIIAGAGLSAAIGSQWDGLRPYLNGNGDLSSDISTKIESVRSNLLTDRPPADGTYATRWQNAAVAQSSTKVGDEWTSQVKRAPHEFNAVGFQVKGEWRDLSLRVSSDSDEWSDWLPVTDCSCHGQTASGDLPTCWTRFDAGQLVPAISGYV